MSRRSARSTDSISTEYVVGRSGRVRTTSRTVGPYAVMYGHAFDGIAAFEQLDLARAEQILPRGTAGGMQVGGGAFAGCSTCRRAAGGAAL